MGWTQNPPRFTLLGIPPHCLKPVPKLDFTSSKDLRHFTLAKRDVSPRRDSQATVPNFVPTTKPYQL